MRFWIRARLNTVSLANVADSETAAASGEVPGLAGQSALELSRCVIARPARSPKKNRWRRFRDIAVKYKFGAGAKSKLLR